MIVRFEVDAFIPKNCSTKGPRFPNEGPSPSLPVKTQSQLAPAIDAEKHQATSPHTSPNLPRAAARQSFTPQNLWDEPESNPSDWGYSSPNEANETAGVGTPIDNGIEWDSPGDDPDAWGPVEPKSVPTSGKAPDDIERTTVWKHRDAVAMPGPMRDDLRGRIHPIVGGPSFILSSETGPPTELQVVRAGVLVPQSDIIEFATRSVKYLDRTNVEDTFLQIFLTQTPVHLVAAHERGTFDRIVREELNSPKLSAVAESESVRVSLARFVALLWEIQGFIKTHARDGGVSLVCKNGKLALFGNTSGEGLLEEEELKRFSGVI